MSRGLVAALRFARVLTAESGQQESLHSLQNSEQLGGGLRPSYIREALDSVSAHCTARSMIITE